MILNTLVIYSKTGLEKTILFWILSNWETRNKMLMLSAITEQYDIIGYRSMSSKASTKFKSMQLSGYGRTTTIDLTWLSAA